MRTRRFLNLSCGVGANLALALSLVGCKPAMPPEPAPGEHAWSVSHPLESRDGAATALTAIKAANGDCSRIYDFAADGASGDTSIFVARCSAEHTLFKVTEDGGAVRAQPLTPTDADTAAAEDDTYHFDGAYGAEAALDTIHNFPAMPCKTLTDFGYKARGTQFGDGTKLYAAICDGTTAYALIQNGGQSQVVPLPAEKAKP